MRLALPMPLLFLNPLLLQADDRHSPVKARIQP